KAVASLRFWVYRRPDNGFTRGIRLRQTSYATLAFLSFATVFFAILPWPQQRYLRERFRFGSPPLSVRCAMIISALTPLTIALAGKVNVITWMTGIGYEKLNIYHRSSPRTLLLMVHDVPHLIAPVQDGGWSMLNKLYTNQARELSGTPLYFTTFGLAFFSIPYIRARFYEVFKYVHIFLGVAYIGMFWWHIYGEYMSPCYIYATVAVLVFPNIVRVLHRHQNIRSWSNLGGFPTSLTHLHGHTTRVVIHVPKAMRWKPGQHIFLRIPSISLLGNHPFAIANVPSTKEQGNTNEMVFLVRRQKGFTKRLLQAEGTELQKPSPLSTLRTIIDGPYSTHHRPLHKIFDTVLCIAGGSGISACLPRILDLTQHLANQKKDQVFATRRIHLIWIIRDSKWISWAERELSTAMHNIREHPSPNKVLFTIDIYVTRTASLAESAA
ncbi:hypothetical protein K458DRAFT_290834, partial [Lentithecium fluviatile CBS 122367]